VVGDPTTPPSRVGISIGDSLAATHACLGALAALHHRHETGRGQVVDCAIYEAVLTMMESLVSEFDQTGHIRERSGAILPKIAPSNVYPSLDGHFLLIAANQNTVFARFCEAIGRPELLRDARFATHEARGENQAALDTLIAGWTRTLTRDAVLAAMVQAGVPAGQIYRAPDMLEDPHFEARQAIVSVDHPRLGPLRMQNVAPKLSVTPGSVRSPGPGLGEHNEAIYRGLLGMGSERLEQLRGIGVI
jgi:formyl-CoA transferase